MYHKYSRIPEDWDYAFYSKYACNLSLGFIKYPRIQIALVPTILMFYIQK